jgi:hypothetical protein
MGVYHKIPIISIYPHSGEREITTMGIPKHGKDSAHSKNCAKYKAEGRRAKNKALKAIRLKKYLEKMAKRRAKKNIAV